MSYYHIGTQKYPGGQIELYNLLIDIPDHPKDSTVSEMTLKEAGIWEGHLCLKDAI